MEKENLENFNSQNCKCLLDLNQQEIFDELKVCKNYIAKQIFAFLHQGKVFDEMTSISKDMRLDLKKNYVDQPIKIREVYEGKDGTKKFLFQLTDGNLIEGVYMLHDYGNTLCVSTQVGCRMGCKFCASGMNGLLRDLSAGEILGQITAVNRHENGSIQKRAITNVVLMGSGEPLDNFDNTMKFLNLVSEKDGICISSRNISLSTSGLCEKIRLLAESEHAPTLTISLHAPNDEIRKTIMAVANKYTVNELIDSAKYYFSKTGRRIIFEYSLIDGKNDRMEDADQLSKLVKGFPAHINLIRLNPVKELGLKGTNPKHAKAFLDRLKSNGTSATIRKSLGNDIDGACGQLRRRYISELENNTQ